MTTPELSGCVIVSGMPGAGKSTVTRLAARLLPRAAQIKADDATRDPSESWEFDGYHRLEADMRRELGDVGWWFDTSALTPEETAEQLVREPVHRGLLK
jgi:Mg-chelatase subunit ChlI